MFESSSQLKRVFNPCVQAIEFCNWNLKYFLIHVEMTLIFFLHGFMLCRFDQHR